MASLTEQISKSLKQDIISGYFPANAKLKLSELKARYQVGTSPIREALFTLSLSGLVSNKSQKGFFVPPMTRNEIIDLYKVRLLTDKQAIRLSCELGDDDWESNILSSYHRLQKLELQDPFKAQNEWEHRHKAFHKSLIMGCNSPKLIELFDLYYDQALRYRTYWFNAYGKKTPHLQTPSSRTRTTKNCHLATRQ